MNVLLIEDDDAIADALVKGLSRDGFTVQRTRDGHSGLAAPRPDVVLLDLGLPDMDGYEVCRRMRATSDVPIIILSARGEEVNRVVGLELGADDYLVKPFGLRELVARIRAVQLRTSAGQAATHVKGTGFGSRDFNVAGANVDSELLPRGQGGIKGLRAVLPGKERRQCEECGNKDSGHLPINADSGLGVRTLSAPSVSHRVNDVIDALANRGR